MHTSRLLTAAAALAVTGALMPAGAAAADRAAGGGLSRSCAPAWQLIPTPPIPGSNTIAGSPQAGTANVAAAGGLISSVDLLSPRDGWIAANTYTGPSWDGPMTSETGAWILRWNGRTVTPAAAQIPVSVGSGSDVSDVSFDSDADGWAVGSNVDTWSGTGAWRWHGGRWTMTPFAEPPMDASTVSFARPESVVSLSPTDAWAAGNSESNKITPSGRYLLEPVVALIEHWDGSQWTVVPNPAQAKPKSYLVALAAVSPADVWAVGEQNTSSGTPVPLIEHWDGTAWSDVPAPPGTGNSDLKAISAVNGNDIWAVGSQNEPGTTSGLLTALAEHWDGSTWTIVKLPDLGNSVLTGVYAAGPSDVYATAAEAVQGGGYYPIVSVFLHWDGSTWTTQTSPLGPREYGVTYWYGYPRPPEVGYGASTSFGGITGSGSGAVMASGWAYNWPNGEPSPQLARLAPRCSTHS